MNDNLHILAQIGENQKTIKCLIDSGSNVNCLNAKFLPKGCSLSPPSSRLYGATLSSQLNCIGDSEVPFKLQEREFIEPMRIVENISCDLLLGRQFFKKYGVNINNKKDTVEFDDGMIIKMNDSHLPDLLSNEKKDVLEKITQHSTCAQDSGGKDQILNILKNEIRLKEEITLKPKEIRSYPITKCEKFSRTPLSMIFRGILAKFKNDKNEYFLEIENVRSKHAVLHQGTRVCEISEQPVSIFNIHESTAIQSDPIPNFNGTEEIHDPDGVPLNINKKLPIHQRIKALKLLHKYRHLFTTKTLNISKARVPPYKIQLSDNIPVNIKPYRASQHERNLAMDYINDLEKAGIVERCSSPYSAPSFIKIKPDSKPRLLTDYSALNKKIIKDGTQSARIEPIIEALLGARMFSKIDMASSYYQFPVAKESRHILAFKYDSIPSQFCYTTMPMGFVNSSQHLTRTLYDIFQDLLFHGFIGYIDDLTVYAEEFEKQLSILEEVLQRLDHYNFQLNTKKCDFFYEEINLLGQVISKGQIKASVKSIEAILKIRPPKTVKGVRSLISSFGFYRKFLKNFTETAKPILQLLQNTATTDGHKKVNWTKECDEAFEKLKRQITSRPTLQIFNPSAKTYLQTDASAFALGSMLLQADSDGNLRPVAYYTERLPQRKKHLTAYDLELIGICKSLKHFRQYLAYKPVTILTDHRNFLNLKITEASLLNPSRVRRILDIINQFDITFEHIKGKENLIPDLLSRGSDFEKIHIISENLSKTQFIEEQNKQKDILGIKRILKNEELDSSYSQPEIKSLSRRARRHELDPHDVLCFKKFNRNERLLLPVAPKSLQKQLLDEVHCSLAKGNHLGETRSYLKLANTVYWPTIRKDIISFVRSCQTCQHYKNTRLQYGKMCYRKKNPRLMKRLSADILGPLTINNQKIYVLVVADEFSKFVFLRALKVVNTEKIIDFLCEILGFFPPFVKLFTDNASYFTSSSLQLFCKMNGITLLHSLPYTPENNGFCEKQNYWISHAIRSLLSDNVINQTNIFRNISLIQRAWNSTPLPSLRNQSPMYIMFGTNCSYINNKYGIPVHHSSRDEELENINQIRKKIPEILEENFNRYAKAHNLRRRNWKIQINDKVLIRNNFPKKMEKRYLGPFRISRIIGNATVEIQDENGNHEPIHISKLRPFHERNI